MRDAPTFADIADKFVDHLRGCVLVAHNARFETTFLRAELARLGMTSPVSDAGALCTMKLATTYLSGSGRKFADCCTAFDIPLDDAHEALADARATSHLLGSYLELGRDQAEWWGRWGDFAARAPWPTASAGRSVAGWVARRREAAGDLDSARNERARGWAIGPLQAQSLRHLRAEDPLLRRHRKRGSSTLVTSDATSATQTQSIKMTYAFVARSLNATALLVYRCFKHIDRYREIYYQAPLIREFTSFEASRVNSGQSV